MLQIKKYGVYCGSFWWRLRCKDCICIYEYVCYMNYYYRPHWYISFINQEIRLVAFDANELSSPERHNLLLFQFWLHWKNETINYAALLEYINIYYHKYQEMALKSNVKTICICIFQLILCNTLYIPKRNDYIQHLKYKIRWIKKIHSF